MDIKDKVQNVYIYYKKREKIFLKILILLLSLILIIMILINSKSLNNKQDEKIIDDKVSMLINEEEKEEEEVKTIKVDVKGNVSNPGVYELTENDRIIDAISLAGGLNGNYSSKYINMSKKLIDEMVIYIFSEEEINTLEEENKKEEKVESLCKEISSDSCYTNNFSSIMESENTENYIIDLNTATIDELTKLEGIGESKAKAIIKYREEIGFKNIEDLMEVSGIGESIYFKIKDYITLR